jgi:hypothetical protein
MRAAACAADKVGATNKAPRSKAGRASIADRCSRSGRRYWSHACAVVKELEHPASRCGRPGTWRRHVSQTPPRRRGGYCARTMGSGSLLDLLGPISRTFCRACHRTHLVTPRPRHVDLDFQRSPTMRARLSNSALAATSSELPDIAMAATSGLIVSGYSTPAAIGNATTL